ncbi:MAG: LPP20 family lipoprotein [Spirochaetaceae bacterium]|nr:LPP20 family lipoprotein [Spirochaetaceae bacterium]
MKKILLAVLSITMLFSLNSCKSFSEDKATPVIQESQSFYPDWFLTLPTDDTYVYCAGYGEASNVQTAIKRAEFNAKTQLAEQISTSVKEVVKNYINDAGEVDNRQNIDAFEAFALQTTEANLVGVQREKIKVLDNGAVCVLSKMPKANLEQAFSAISNEAKKEFVQNDAAQAANDKMAESFDNLLANGII